MEIITALPFGDSRLIFENESYMIHVKVGGNSMDAIFFDMFLELEYGDEEQSLSGAIHDCSLEITQVASNALSKVSAHFAPERKEPQFTASQESIESAEFLIEMTIFYLL